MKSGNEDYIELEDVAEVLAYVMSQEKIMSVPPVLIPTDGVSVSPAKPKKQRRNVRYKKKDPREAQSVSLGSGVPEGASEFPIEPSCTVEVEDQWIL